MEATCKTCNHWENDTPTAQSREGFGECGVLSQDTMAYVLPVVQNESLTSANVMTKADFGCNQYDG